MTSIGDWAFCGNTGLISIVIPDSVTMIGIRTFCRCTGLTSVVIPNSVKSIGNSAFSKCTRLTSIVIPDSVMSIAGLAFFRCPVTIYSTRNSYSYEYALKNGIRWQEKQKAVIPTLGSESLQPPQYNLASAFPPKIATIIITKQEWTGWIRCQPEPVQESREIKSGDKITLEWLNFLMKADVYIKSLDEDGVELRFSTEGIVEANSNGTINLLSDEDDWTVKVCYCKSYRIVTQMMDAGCSWTLSFEK